MIKVRYTSLLILCALFLCILLIPITTAQTNTTGLSVTWYSKHGTNNGYTNYTPYTDTAKGDVLLFQFTVLNASENDQQSSHLTVSLSFVTNYPRVFMNTQKEIDSIWAPDLAFATRAEHVANNLTPGLRWEGGGESLTVRWNNAIQGPVRIFVRCNDAAAYGVLIATLYRKTPYILPIPWDVTTTGRTPANYIADAYDALYPDSARNIAGNITDNESGPSGNTHNGDGLSYWEEYRGFVINGDPKRLNPTVKDVFVYSELSEGYGYASSLESITGSENAFSVWLIRIDELTRFNEITPNAREENRVLQSDGTRLYQRAIYVRADRRPYSILKPEFDRQFGTDAKVAGWATPRGTYTAPNAPAAMTEAVIFTQIIPDDLPLNSSPSTISDRIANVIGHEVLHHLSVNDITSQTPVTNAVWNSSIMVSSSLMPLISSGNDLPPYHNPEYNLYPH